MMRPLFMALWLCLTIAVYGTDNNHYDIIPMPKNLTPAAGQFKLTDKTTIFVSPVDEALLKIAENFKTQILSTSAISLKVKSSKKQALSKKGIHFTKNPQLGDEAYNLSVTPDKVIIESSTPTGAFYAIQTLYQMLPAEVYGESQHKDLNWSIPCVAISDEPRFGYRGMLLDVGRHFMPVDFIKQFIDVMAMHKLNRLQWHLTEDQGWRIEIKKYPRLIEIGSVRKETVVGRNSQEYDGIEHKGYYTQEEAKEIVRYASERGITIIPEIELPGHALAAVASYPELSCGLEESYEVGKKWGVFNQVYCPKESTFSFLEDVFTELFEIFSSPYYHIGGDECPKDSWKKCSHCQEIIKTLNLKNESELQSYFVKRMETFLNAHGKQIIGWDEILEGGLAPNASVTVRNGEKTCIEVAKSKHNVIETYAYLDYHQEHELNSKVISIQGGFLSLEQTYKYEPCPKALSPDEAQYIKGVGACIWTEYIKTPQRVIEQMFPRAFAFSEVGWTPAGLKDYDSFRNRVPSGAKRIEQALKMQQSNTFYSPIFYYDRWWVSEYPKELRITLDYPRSTLRYTTDGSDPTDQSPVYTQPLQVKKGDVVKAAGFENGKQVGEIKTVVFR